MRRCTLDKIASVTKGLALGRHVVLGETIPAEQGAVVAARVLSAKTTYEQIEDVHGRFVRLFPGDVIAGALGKRDALHGFSGRVPERVAVGDELQLLNMGGVIGTGAAAVPQIGEPFRLEVLGAVLRFSGLDRRHGVPARIADGALERPPLPQALPPLVALVGTSMDSGKTTAATALVTRLAHRGLRVAAGKLTGVSLRRDVLAMADCGADPTAIFTDFGVVTTDESNAVPAAHALLAHLAAAEPDVVVLEMGDGLLGTYGVHALLEDATLRGALTCLVLCANDPVGVWGATRLVAKRYGLSPAVVTGPVTDTPVGRRYCAQELGVPGWNALLHGDELAASVEQAIGGARSTPQAEVSA